MTLHGIQDIIEWSRGIDVNSKPWLLLGKGPSFSRVSGVRLDDFHTLALNHVVREFPVTLAHVIDIDVVTDCADAIYRNARWLAMPYRPHVRCHSTPKTLPEFAAEIPVLAAMERENRLIWYNLSSTDPVGTSPVIQAKFFSAEAALNLLAACGVRTVRSLGIDGGDRYSPRFEDLNGTTLLANGRESFDRQFEGMAETIRRTGIFYAPLHVDAPVRVFVGADEAQTLAARVLEYSVRKHASLSVEVVAIDNRDIPEPRDPANGSRTGFSFCRYRIPELCGYSGRAIYLDADMLVLQDIARLWTLPLDDTDILYAAQPPEHGRIPQTSVMLMNCATLRWDVRDIVRGLDDGRYGYEDLMQNLCIVPRERFKPLLPREWNSLEHYEEARTCLLHYTDMPTQPWVTQENRNGHLWYTCLREAVAEGFIPESHIHEEIRKGHVSPDLPRWIGLKESENGAVIAGSWIPPYRRFAHEDAVPAPAPRTVGWEFRSDDLALASVRYRALMPMVALRERGFGVAAYREEDESAYSAVVFSKLYDAEHQRIAERLRGGGTQVILDLCDNHFYNPQGSEKYRRARENLLRMISLSDLVVCSTPVLADVVMKEAGLATRPEVVGDAIEPLPLIPASVAAPGGPPRLLWFGNHGSPNAPGGMLDLLNIGALLERLYRELPFELVVVSNDRAKFDAHIALLPFPTRYVDWDSAAFAAELAAAAAVVIPITRNPFTECKSNNRLATALAAGVPVVADRIPSYEEFAAYCYLGDWESGLRTVLTKREQALERTRPGRAYVMENWTVRRIAQRWEEILTGRGLARNAAVPTDAGLDEQDENYRQRLLSQGLLKAAPSSFGSKELPWETFVNRYLEERLLFRSGPFALPADTRIATLVVLVDRDPGPELHKTLEIWSLQSCPATDAIVLPCGEAAADDVRSWLERSGDAVRARVCDASSPLHELLRDSRYAVFARPGDLHRPSLATALAHISRREHSDVVVWNSQELVCGEGSAATYELHRRPRLEPFTLRHTGYIGRCFAVRPEVARAYPEDLVDHLLRNEGHLFHLWLAEQPGLTWHTHPEYLSVARGKNRFQWSRHLVKPFLEEYRRRFGDAFALSVGKSDQDPPYRLQPHRAAQRVSVVVPYRNRPEHTMRCLESLLRQRLAGELEVLLVDNQSTAATRSAMSEWIRASGRDGIFRTLPYDRPFNHSRQCQLGVEQSRGEVIVFLNNDAALASPTALGEMAAWALVPGIGTVGCRVETPGGALVSAGVRARHRGRTDFLESFVEESTDPRFATCIRETFCNTFACAAISRAVVERAGPLDDVDFPNGYNDVEYCLRLRRMGYVNLYLGHLLAHHKPGTSRAKCDESLQRAMLKERYPEAALAGAFQLECEVRAPAPPEAAEIEKRFTRRLANRFRRNRLGRWLVDESWLGDFARILLGKPPLHLGRNGEDGEKSAS